MARRAHKLVCKQCSRFFRTTRKSDRLCPKCKPKEKG